jgi:hypothetical protein
MLWNQHLNHQRPDAGGAAPYSLPTVRPETPIRGGTISLRDPSALTQLNTPFDPFAHVADVKPPEIGQVAYNIPNLAIYLWRLKDYRLRVTKPLTRKVTPALGAPRVVRVNVSDIPINALSAPYVLPINTPAGRCVTLFNTNRLALFASDRSGPDALNLSAMAPRISTADHVPGPMPRDRISDYDIAAEYDASLASAQPQPLRFFTEASFTAPQDYVSVETFEPAFPVAAPQDDLKSLDISDTGLQIHLPEPDFPGELWPHTTSPRFWKIRGENLCAWERGLKPPLADREIAIDPVTGRICIGVSNDPRADAIEDKMLLTYTYGAVGPVGAHPISYPALPKDFSPALASVYYRDVILRDPAKQLQATLKTALEDARAASVAENPFTAIIIEIKDSRTHPFDTAALNALDRNGEVGASILLTCPLILRSADGERPILELARPLAFRSAQVRGTTVPDQTRLDAFVAALFVRLEGIYIARRSNFAAGLPLISRAAMNKLEVINCTLDPGGFRHLNGNRAPLLPGIQLNEPYGFASNLDEVAFKETPDIIVQRSICGAIFTDEGYSLCISDSIIESVPIPSGPNVFSFALTNSSNPVAGYSGATTIRNVTVFGRVRATSIEGAGGIFTGVVEAFDQQRGCLKYCYFADDSSPPPPNEIKNLLPPHFACVFGDEARLLFTSGFFGDPAYGQISLQSDPRILQEGVDDDQMGAFNFLLEAHKWRNLRIRFREFMPVGIRPLLIPVT